MPEETREKNILPDNVKPKHYDIELTLDTVGFTFTGTVVIDLQVNKESTEIKVNCNEVEVKEANITSTEIKTSNTQKASNVAHDSEKEITTLTFPVSIPTGPAKLTMHFTGILNDKMAGFYRSSYHEDGQTKYMFVTQFEATDARRAFPCWDEPALKATYDVTLNVPSHLTALSNMPVISETPVTVGGKGPGKGPSEKGPSEKGPSEKGPSEKGPAGDAIPYKKVKFATIPIMSTYLVAFAVGDIEYVEAQANPKAPSNAKPFSVRVYARKGQKHQSELAAGVAVKTLEFLSQYFNEPYMAPKMDLIAVPDFAAGAMENTGLVTYREAALLYDAEKSSAAARQSITYVIGHENSHQWFGNLVTMSFWDQLWLNEGFATFVGWLATESLHPEWDVFSQFVIADLQRGLTLDALRSSHPIEVPIYDASEVNQIFDAISYSKGASVIRMLDGWLGRDTFMNGVRNYIQKFKYGNTVTTDLWTCLGEAAGKDVKQLMSDWTLKTGFPLVTVESSQVKDGKLHLKLSQQRYLSTGDLTPEEDKSSPVWQIPLGILTSKGPGGTLVMNQKVQEFVIDGVSDGFFKLNANQTGFYRVRYQPEQLKTIGANISKLGTSDRAGILTDVFALAQAGYTPTTSALDLVKNYDKETDYIVLQELATRLGQMSSVFYEDKTISDGLKKLSAQIYGGNVKELGWDYPASEKNDHLKSLKRTLCIREAAKAGDEGTVKECQERFEKFVKGDKEAIHPNLRSTVFATALRNANDEATAKQVLNSIVDAYKAAETADQKLAALSALGASGYNSVVDETLKLALDDAIVKPQDIMYPVASLTRENPDPAVNRPKTWKWVQDNWNHLHTKLAASLTLLGRVVQFSVEGIVDEKAPRQVKDWVEGVGLSDEDKQKRQGQVKGISMMVNQSLETMNANNRWVSRDGPSVSKWFGSGGK